MLTRFFSIRNPEWKKTNLQGFKLDVLGHDTMHSGSKTEAVHPSIKLVITYQTKWCHNPEHHNCLEDLKCQLSLRRNLNVPLRISAISRSTRHTSLLSGFRFGLLPPNLFDLIVLCAARSSCFWRCSFSCTEHRHINMMSGCRHCSSRATERGSGLLQNVL
jgi:hypothetical protein